MLPKIRLSFSYRKIRQAEVMRKSILRTHTLTIAKTISDDTTETILRKDENLPTLFEVSQTKGDLYQFLGFFF